MMNLTLDMYVNDKNKELYLPNLLILPIEWVPSY